MGTRVKTASLILVALSVGFAVALPAQDTRQQREDIERLIDQAPNQGSGSVSSPGDTPFSEGTYEPAQRDREIPLLWDVGGWGRMTYSSFDTPFGKDTTLRDYDLRVWGKLEYKKNHQLYARLRSFYTDYNTNDGDSNWQNIRGDQIYYTGKIARMMGWKEKVDFDLSVGRQFFYIGNGAALANVLDGARAYYRNGMTNMELIAARTVKYTPDFDPSVNALQSRNESDRFFYAITASTRAFFERKFYGYVLTQVDENNKSTPGQSYDYNSTYLGIGSEGALPIPGAGANEFSYKAEFIQQFGKGAAQGTTQKENINAQSLMLDFYWLTTDRMSEWLGLPRLTSRFIFSYYFGSGDADRSQPIAPGSAIKGPQIGTNPGNKLGTNDSAFNYFGFVNTGYSLSPRLTNLHMVRMNYESSLIERPSTWNQALKAGFSYYLFWKHHKEAIVSDFTSVQNSAFVGSEFDAYVDWSPTNDLDLGARFGYFMPGDAYSQDDGRAYVSAFLSLSF